MGRRIITLSTLRGFEAAARLGSFAQAAEELHLTHSAISHQVKLLESELGQPLFRRIARSVVLTDAGADFARTVRQTLRLLEDGVTHLAPYQKPGSVILYTTMAFARGFIMSRLGQFRSEHPDVDLWLDTGEHKVDFETDEVDILITQSQGVAGRRAVDQDLLADRQIPAAAPALIARMGGVPPDPAVIAQWPLLHDESLNTWHEWFLRLGRRNVEAVAGANFSDHALMLDAAVAGHGAAIVSAVCAQRHLDSGALVPLPGPVFEQPSHRIYCDIRRFDNDRVRRTYEWLVREAAEYSNNHPQSISENNRD